MVAAMLLLVTGSVFATDGKIEKEKGKVELKKEVKAVELDKDELKGECTVSISGQVSIPGLTGTIACSATEASCDVAIDKAIECVKATLKRLRVRFLA